MIQNAPLVSVIMPAYNSEHYIHEAIQSVVDQLYVNWELLIINDGCEDQTQKIIDGFKDPRIKSFYQENAGVSAARNLGLSNMAGEYVCFLDSDDVLTPTSINDRVNFFLKHPNVDFVDGIVLITDANLNIIKTWHPSFQGEPLRELVRLKESCFVTISWMVRAATIGQIRFEGKLSHGEDLVFFSEISRASRYEFVSSPVLKFRRTGSSAMSNLQGLAEGYQMMFQIFKQHNLFANTMDRIICKLKIMKIMFLSFFSSRKYRRAFNFVLAFALQ